MCEIKTELLKSAKLLICLNLGMEFKPFNCLDSYRSQFLFAYYRTITSLSIKQLNKVIMEISIWIDIEFKKYFCF